MEQILQNFKRQNDVQNHPKPDLLGRQLRQQFDNNEHRDGQFFAIRNFANADKKNKYENSE